MCDLCAVAKGPRPVDVPADGSGGFWARSYELLAAGREETDEWNRHYLERNNLGRLVERLEAEGVGLRREPRADGEDYGDG